MPSDPAQVERDPVSVVHFGRDHYSTLLYVEARVVDHRGRPNIRNMRCDAKRHPQFNHLPPGVGGESPTRLANGDLLSDHDDWDCVQDMVAAGWIEEGGTGLQPVWRLTPSGWAAAHNRRRALAEEREPRP
jgi:hypothetical protein